MASNKTESLDFKNNLIRFMTNVKSRKDSKIFFQVFYDIKKIVNNYLELPIERDILTSLRVQAYLKQLKKEYMIDLDILIVEFKELFKWYEHFKTLDNSTKKIKWFENFVDIIKV